jgi:putative ATP-binding cassette transporter
MTDVRASLNRQSWDRFVRNIRQFAASGATGRKAKWLFALLLLFMFAINGLNVVNSFIGRFFMTAIENRNQSEFMRQALFYIGIFAALTVVATIYRYIEERLGLLWREWATRKAVTDYANHRVYYRLKSQGDVGNPDQRIADDIRTFTVTTLSFLLMMLNGSFTVIAFSGVLWSISPELFVVSVCYATAGSYLTYRLGRPLIRLNYDQLDKEANFRSSLIYLRANAESVALSRREGHLLRLGLKNLNEVVQNFLRIIAINRNVNFFTTGYNWLIQIIPALIVAPLFIKGKVEFGVITQSAIAFTQLLGAFSLIVTQFQSISSYTAVLARLSSMSEAIKKERDAELSTSVFSKNEQQIGYQEVTLVSPRSGRTLIKDLTLTFPHGTRVLVRGKDASARSALFHVTAGLGDVSAGQIIRPHLAQIIFVTETPFLPPGTLRELLLQPWPEIDQVSEQHLRQIEVQEKDILQTLKKLNLESLLSGFGGLDTRRHWENSLPLSDQQLLVIARILLAKPRFVFLDKPGATLSPEQIDWVLDLLTEHEITYVTFAENGTGLERYDAVLELPGGGAWSFKPPAQELSPSTITEIVS